MELSEQERTEIIKLIESGTRLPGRYRLSLFGDVASAELIWPGKSGDVERSVLPFQSIERVDEPRPEVNEQFDMFSVDDVSGRQSSGWTNKLIWGENKLVLSSLANGPLRDEIEHAGGLKLVYIDPPFDVGADFSLDIEIGDASVTKQPSVVETVAYRDTWGRGQDSYAQMIYERILLLRDLLAEDGTIYVHCDWRVSGIIRLVLDEVFGGENHRNEIVWHYKHMSNVRKDFARKHDTIFRYTKGPEFTFNMDAVREPYDEKTLKRYENDVVFPGGYKAQANPLGKVPDDVWVIPPVRNVSAEKVAFPTQKPESLLEKILLASSDPGDLVADFFCGSGTTLAVAERLGRKWIGADLGRFAVHTTRKRLIQVQRELRSEGTNYRAFEILNLGSYERQYFLGVDTTLPAEARSLASAERERLFHSLVLEAYAAKEAEQIPPFHGVKGSTAIFIGPVDAPVTAKDVTSVISSARANGITRADVLGFEFEMGISPSMVDEAKEIGVSLALRYIPRDVFDKRAIAKGQVSFYNVGYVEVTPRLTGDRAVVVELSDFGVFYAQADADAAAAGLRNGASRVVVDQGQVVRVSKDKQGIMAREVLTKSWTDWIDYWAVDFDFESQKELIRVDQDGEKKQVWTGRYLFENEWQSFRTRADRTLELTSNPRQYDQPGTYKVAVKVIDVFGNDTTKVITVKVK